MGTICGKAQTVPKAVTQEDRVHTPKPVAEAVQGSSAEADSRCQNQEDQCNGADLEKAEQVPENHHHHHDSSDEVKEEMAKDGASPEAEEEIEKEDAPANADEAHEEGDAKDATDVSS